MMKTKMTIGKRFALTGAFVTVLTLALGIVSLNGLGRLERMVHSLRDDALAGLAAADQVQADLLEMRGNILQHIVLNDARNMSEVEREIERVKQRMGQDLAVYEKTIRDEEDRALFGKIGPAVERYQRAWDSIVTVSRAGRNEEAFGKYLTEANPAFLAAKEAAQALTEVNRQEGERYSATAAAMAGQARWLTWIVLAIAVVAGSLSVYWIVRGVNRALRRAVGELNSGAEQVASAAGQVSSSSQSLAQGASEQAASLEETSASTEEINSTARKNTENSRAAVEVVTASEQKFTEARRMLEQMVAAMAEIGTSSDKISKIIKVIDEIAFQTNILALNAAVEAARAGEAGMGFAVVADEVRNLAQRSAQAAKDTAALIEESIARSQEGKTKVDRVADAIHSVTADVGKVKMLVEEVSLSSNEQAQGIEQIARAVAQMQQVTQRTAANAEESASAAEELNAQAATVKEIVNDLNALVRATAERAAAGKPRGRARAAGGLKALGRAVAQHEQPALQAAGDFKEF